MNATIRVAVARLTLVVAISSCCGCVSLNMNTARKVARVVSWGSEDFVTARKSPENPLADQLQVWSDKGAKPSERTQQVLRKEAITSSFDNAPEETIRELRTRLEKSPSLDSCYAVAELAYVAGKNADSKGKAAAAIDLYEMSVAYAYMFLFDPRFEYQRNPYDPRFRQTCNLYNVALEGGLRLLKDKGKLKPGQTHTINSCGKQFHIEIKLGDTWRGDQFDSFEFASDYEVNGLNNQHRSYGLGVPLIAVRSNKKDDPLDGYFPNGLAVPITAVLKVDCDQYSGATSNVCTLELIDPMKVSEVSMAGKSTPIESDLTTPLAYYLNDPLLSTNALATFALLDANFGNDFSGLYMLEPYDPDRIPVVMVHGLWSSPTTWMQMFNDLRAMPEIRQRYQFWFYLYPTGQPFWVSAKQMRSDLSELYDIIDPKKDHYNLSQMVLIGHSMGGLVSRMQTIDSGDRFWETVADRPIDQLKGDPEQIQELAATLYFQPNTSVKRVITLGTPHRGSNFANPATRWISRNLFQLSSMMTGGNELVTQNPNFFHQTDLLTISTSIDSLAPDSPIFPAMLQAQRAPWVKFHNIIGKAPPTGVFGYFAGESDGIVSVESARMPDVVSEKIVAADHVTVHQNPNAVLETRRILLEHIVEVQAQRERILAVTRPQPVAPQSSPVRSQPAPMIHSPASRVRYPTQPVAAEQTVEVVAPLVPWQDASLGSGRPLTFSDEVTRIPPPENEPLVVPSASDRPIPRQTDLPSEIIPPLPMSELPRGRLRPELR